MKYGSPLAPPYSSLRDQSSGVELIRHESYRSYSAEVLALRGAWSLLRPCSMTPTIMSLQALCFLPLGKLHDQSEFSIRITDDMSGRATTKALSYSWWVNEFHQLPTSYFPPRRKELNNSKPEHSARLNDAERGGGKVGYSEVSRLHTLDPVKKTLMSWPHNSPRVVVIRVKAHPR